MKVVVEPSLLSFPLSLLVSNAVDVFDDTYRCGIRGHQLGRRGKMGWEKMSHNICHGPFL